ncbi:hypothetical protein LCGC14_2061860 [marine sediment metagenome]|uniref:Uncharacterized protein n=1 Tax=marine sediment metagenome TaxID=412755 RepID=A0A0F9F8B7_9ZZZZ
MPSVVPDRIEPVVAYRIWRFYPTSHLLHSYGWTSQVWITMVGKEAYHVSYSDTFSPHNIDQCPGSQCSGVKCGIYGLKERIMPYDWAIGEIVGEVYLWGLIVEHELGYRAEYAYPKCLYLDGAKDDTIRMIASNYRIPVTEPPKEEDMFSGINQYQIGVDNAISRDTGVQG